MSNSIWSYIEEETVPLFWKNGVQRVFRAGPVHLVRRSTVFATSCSGEGKAPVSDLTGIKLLYPVNAFRFASCIYIMEMAWTPLRIFLWWKRYGNLVFKSATFDYFDSTQVYTNQLAKLKRDYIFLLFRGSVVFLVLQELLDRGWPPSKRSDDFFFNFHNPRNCYLPSKFSTKFQI